jgi:hypothetical protein
VLLSRASAPRTELVRAYRARFVVERFARSNPPGPSDLPRQCFDSGLAVDRPSRCGEPRNHHLKLGEADEA